MRDDTQSDQTPAPQAEDRAVGVASLPDEGTGAEDRQPRLVDNGDHDYSDDDEHDYYGEPNEDGMAEARGTSEAPAGETGATDEAGEAQEPGVPTQRVDAEQPRAGGVPRDEARDDVGSRDVGLRDTGAPEDAPMPAVAYQLAGERAGDADETRATDQPAAMDETRAAGHIHHDELMPGDVPEQQLSGLFEQHAAERFRDRWQRVQMHFVDDPKSAADQARRLVDDVFAAARAALDEKRRALDSWRSEQSDDTEQLRVAVRGYRDFLDGMLGL
jgi:hypothetical protein